MDKRKIKKRLIEILTKKASGYYYIEKIYEFEKTQKTPNNSKKQLSFFENKQISKKSVSQNITLVEPDDNIELIADQDFSDSSACSKVALTKKKITTHYIPPDMLSIKILLGMCEEKIGDIMVQNLSDDELIKLKDQLIGEIKDEDYKNSKANQV